MLEGLKEAVASLEGSAKQPAKPTEAITLGDLRTELRVLASSLNEYAPPLALRSHVGCMPHAAAVRYSSSP